MRRTLATLATLAVAGAALFAISAPAGAAGAVTVTPGTNITDGTSVTVSWTGLTPNGTPSIVQCKPSPATGAGGADCEFQTLQVAEASNGAGAGTDTFIVHDTAGLAGLNPRTEVQCDPTHGGSIAVLDNPNDPSSGANKSISCAVTVAPVAGHVLLSCSGTRQIGTLNPTMGSNSAKYVKGGFKDSIGDKTEFFTASTVPADATTCAVDPGISTTNPSSDSTKPNPYDNQTNGAATLTTTGLTAKTTFVLDGSATCQTAPQGTVNNDYSQAYPLRGQLTVKFDQLSAPTPSGATPQIALGASVRLGKDSADPDPTHYALLGLVTKGPGAGGEIHGTVRLVPTTSVKNVNPGECSDPDVTDDSNNASLAEMALTLADGADQNTAVDPWVVTIP